MKILLLFSAVLVMTVTLSAKANIPDEFILIKGGSFTMGSPAKEPERQSDEKEHQVSVRYFYLARSSVTQREYRALMGENPSENIGDNLPVESVTWFEAVRYCNARSTKEGLTPAYTIDGENVSWNYEAAGYRLPTEAEWEYACRAETKTPFNTGNSITDKQANCYNRYGYNNDSSGQITGGSKGSAVPVNSYPPNRWGLYDMHGNTADWCWDWYGEYGAAAQTNPQGPIDGTLKVYRGGGWNDFPKHIRSAYRAALPPENASFNLGFRLARNAQ